jgi:hypothetical protein
MSTLAQINIYKRELKSSKKIKRATNVLRYKVLHLKGLILKKKMCSEYKKLIIRELWGRVKQYQS